MLHLFESTLKKVSIWIWNWWNVIQQSVIEPRYNQTTSRNNSELSLRKLVKIVRGQKGKPLCFRFHSANINLNIPNLGTVFILSSSKFSDLISRTRNFFRFRFILFGPGASSTSALKFPGNVNRTWTDSGSRARSAEVVVLILAQSQIKFSTSKLNWQSSSISSTCVSSVFS